MKLKSKISFKTTLSLVSIAVLSISLLTTVYILNSRRNISPEKSSAATPTSMEGVISYSIIDYSDGRVGYSYSLERADKTVVDIDYKGKPNFSSGSTVRVAGTLDSTSNKLAVAGSSTIDVLSQGPLAAVPTNKEDWKITVVRVVFSNSAVPNYTADKNKILEISGIVDDYYDENSASVDGTKNFSFYVPNDNLHIIPAVITLSVPEIPENYCQGKFMRNLLKTATLPQEVKDALNRPTNNQRIIFTYPSNTTNCVLANLAINADANVTAVKQNIGGLSKTLFSVMIPSSKLDGESVTHELGHTLGLMHANGYECGNDQTGTLVTSSPKPGECIISDYSDIWDVMATGLGHLSAFRKEALGWLDADEITKMSVYDTSKEYLVYPLENNNGSGNLRHLKVANWYTTEYYSVENRQSLGLDAGAPALWTYGLLIKKTGRDYFDNSVWASSDLIDTTPNSLVSSGVPAPAFDFFDAALGIGKTFDDPINKVKIKYVEKKADGAIRVKVDRYNTTTPSSLGCRSDGTTWCSNHAGVALTIPYDITSWSQCLAWCKENMNVNMPLCQFNDDGPRSCWINIPPGTGINDCIWQQGVPSPYGACLNSTSTAAIFADVPVGSFAQPEIESVYKAGITSGCSTTPLNYCPNDSVTRAQMAIFLLKAKHGSDYSPPVASGTGFADVPISYWAAPWIEELSYEGITGGCGGNNYCPEAAVTRAQMAVFLLKTKHGSSYTPPVVGLSTGFTDVTADYWASAWIKELVAEGITSGCGNGNYCPEAAVTRAQMAVFLQRTFNLPLGSSNLDVPTPPPISIAPTEPEASIIPTEPSATITPTPALLSVCLSSAKSGSLLTPNSPIQITIEGRTLTSLNNPLLNIKTFFLSFHNLDNLISLDNPRPIKFKGNNYVVSQASTNQNSQTFTVTYDHLNNPDENWKDNLPKNILVRGYFLLSNGVQTAPELTCMQSFILGKEEEGTGTISGKVSLEFKNKKDIEYFNDKIQNENDPVDQIAVYLVDKSIYPQIDNYLNNENLVFNENDFPKNEYSKEFTFDKLLTNHNYELYAKAIKNQVPLNIGYHAVADSTKECPNAVCQLVPSSAGNTIEFKITFPKKYDIIAGQNLNQDFMNMIDKWTNNEINAVKMSEFITQIQDAPGLKKATCDPTIPGGCQFIP